MAINSLDPEIKLAARFSMDKSDTAVNTTTPSDDDQEVDEFVSSHGFEFIDGDNDSRGRVLDSDDDSSGELFPSAVDSHMHQIPLPNLSPSHSLERSAPSMIIKLMLGFHGSQSHPD